MNGETLRLRLTRLIGRFGAPVTHVHGAATYHPTAVVTLASNSLLAEYFPFTLYDGFSRPVRVVTIAGDYRQADGSPVLGDTVQVPDPAGAPGATVDCTVAAIDRKALGGVVVKTMLIVAPA